MARQGGRGMRLGGSAALVIGALTLVASAAFPYWRMRVAAPQYPKGLMLSIHLNRLEGDVREIDTLNHYIGMRPLEDGAKLERRLAVPGLIVAVTGLVLAAVVPAGWGVVLALPAMALPGLFVGDLYAWMRDYGLNLNPRAPLNRAVKPFVPALLGQGRIAQFDTIAWFDVGFRLAVAAAALALCGLWLRRSGRPSAKLAVLLAGGLCLTGGGAADAATIVVGEPGAPTLGAALRAAQDGDTVVARGGVHQGPLVVPRRVTLIGEERPVIDGGGQGTVLELRGAHARVQGFVIRHSGALLAESDAGILVTGAGAQIEDTVLTDVLFGIVVRRAPGTLIRGNTIHSQALPVPRRGDAMRIWYSDGVVIEGNRISDTRDVVLWYSKGLIIRGNTITRGRYGLHFMYCNESLVEDNALTDNSVGAYLMYSAHLTLRRNRLVHNRGPSGYGLGLKDMDQPLVEDNVILDNRVGVFLEQTSGQFLRNVIAANDVGLRLLPSARQSEFAANSLVDNGDQVASDGASVQSTNRWAGNYWSDYRGYDRDGDGVGDVPHRPVRVFERLTERYPSLKLYTDSPVVRALEFGAQLFPLFAPQPTLVDGAPLMRARLP